MFPLVIFTLSLTTCFKAIDSSFLSVWEKPEIATRAIIIKHKANLVMFLPLFRNNVKVSNMYYSANSINKILCYISAVQLVPVVRIWPPAEHLLATRCIPESSLFSTSSSSSALPSIYHLQLGCIS